MSGRGGGGGNSWVRKRVNCLGSCHLPALPARLQPLTSLSLVTARDEPGVEVYQIGRRLIGMR